MPSLAIFFGAGASKPFGVPTMKEMVTELERDRLPQANVMAQKLYLEVRQFLQTNFEYVDLESIFSVLDNIAKATAVRDLGFFEAFFLNRGGANPNYQFSHGEVLVARQLVELFKEYVVSRCDIREDSAFSEIERIYQDFFGRLPLASRQQARTSSGGSFNFPPDIVMYTTNYDTSLEYFWRDYAQIGLATGFEPRSSGLNVFNEGLLMGSGMKLVKLHGSVTWYLRDDGLLTEQQSPPEERRTFGRRRFTGRLMVYPIQEKALYLDPWLPMIHQMKKDLQQTGRWLSIGYSFNDPILRQLLTESSVGKRLTIVHPEASVRIAPKLREFRGTLSCIDNYFGRAETHEAIKRDLSANP